MNTPSNLQKKDNEAAPTKRSIVKTILFILWLTIAIGWFYFIATWQ